MAHRWLQADATLALEVVTGTDATIHFDAQKCIHSRGCVLSYPNVFVPNVQDAWIHPDAQPVKELLHIAKNCPSGAIRVVRNAPAAGQAPNAEGAPMVNTVRVGENGPLAMEAELLIGGVAQASPRATLCRCGQSNNKPNCYNMYSASRSAHAGPGCQTRRRQWPLGPSHCGHDPGARHG